MFSVLAIHHPSSDRFEEAVTAMQAVLESIQGSEGLVDGYVGSDLEKCQVIALTLWRQSTDFEAVFPRVGVQIEKSGVLNWVVKLSRAFKFEEALGGSGH